MRNLPWILGWGAILAFAACDILGTPMSIVTILIATLATLLARRGGRIKQQAGKTFLALTAFAIAIVSTDGFLRFSLMVRFSDRPEEQYAYRLSHRYAVRQYEANRSIRQIVHGDLAALPSVHPHRHYRDVTFSTDRFGFRNHRSAADQNVDLILLGDSFAAGSGNSQEEIFAALLQQRFGHRVYNLAINGDGPWGQSVLFELNIDRLHPVKNATVLWVLFTGNDLIDAQHTVPASEVLAGGSFERVISDFATWRRRSPIHRLITNACSTEPIEPPYLVRKLPTPHSGSVLFWRAYEQQAQLPADVIRRDDHLPGIVQAFKRVCAICTSRGYVLKVAVVPTKEEVYSWLIDGREPWSHPAMPSGFYTVMAEMCQREDVRCLDLKPALMAAARNAYERDRSLLWWQDDSHVNGLGHQVIAETLQESLLPPPPSSPEKQLTNAAEIAANGSDNANR